MIVVHGLDPHGQPFFETFAETHTQYRFVPHRAPGARTARNVACKEVGIMTQHFVPSRHPVRAIIAAVAVLSIGLLAGCSSSPPPASGGAGGNPVHMRVASYIGMSSPSTIMSQQWTDLVTDYTDGDVTFEWFLSESLLPAAEILAGVGNGTVEMGLAAHGYHPGELPLYQAVAVGFVSANSQAVTATLRDFYESNDAFKAEWDTNNVRPLLDATMGSVVLGCNFPVDGIDDLKGKNIRAAGLGTADFTSIGANVVAVTAPDTLDAFDRGVIDCWSSLDLALANDIGLTQITPYVYDYGRGTPGGQNLIISQDVWDSLSDSQRDAMERATDEVYEEYFTTTLGAAALAGCDAIKEGGGTMSSLSDSAEAEWKALAGPANAKRFLEVAGADGQKFLDEYTSAVQENEAEFDSYVDPDVTCAERFQG